MGQKPNWGAGLVTLGEELGNYNERRRREMALQKLREQQVADRELARQQELDDREAGYVRQDDLNTQSQGMILPESMYLPGGEATMGGLGGMRMKPAVATLRDMYPQQRQSNQPTVPPVSFVIDDNGQRLVVNSDQERFTQDVSRFETPLAVPRLSGNDDNGLPVFRMTAIPRPETGGQRAATPSEERLAASELQERIKTAVRGDIGDPATLLRGVKVRDKNGKVVDSYDADIPSRGGGQFINHEDFGLFENPQAAGNAYAGSLADTVAARGLTAYDQLPGGVIPIDARSNAWSNIAKTQPVVPMPIPQGWEFRGGNTPQLDDDEFVYPIKGKKDNNRTPLEFFKEHIIPIAERTKDPLVAWRSLVETAKTYNVDPNSLLKMLDPNKFSFLFSAAQDSVVEDKIKKIFGGK